MPELPKFLGVVDDPRSEVAKAQDFQHDEIAPASAAPVQWTEKPQISWRKFKERDQNGSGMCMAQSGVKILGIENVLEEGEFVELSALPPYQARQNQGSAGMWMQDILALLSKPYACRESQVPSQKLSEAQANSPKITLSREQRSTAEFYRANGYLFHALSMDSIAPSIDAGKGVQIMLYFLDEEYWKPVPTMTEPELVNSAIDERVRRHGVAIVDRTMYEGEKAFIIEDSAGPWTGFSGGQRVIKESFFKKRCYGAGYLAYRKNEADAVPEKPKVNFAPNLALTFGMMGNANVALLQKILQYEGYLITHIDNQPLPLGNMLQMTCTALKKWQVAHNIMDFANEPDIRKVRFGPKSVGLANTLYA